MASCNLSSTEQLERSFHTSSGAWYSSLAPHLTQTRAFSMASKLSNVISYYCWVYLANRLSSCSLDISGTGVKNLRNFAFAGASNRVPFPTPAIYTVPFLPSFLTLPKLTITPTYGAYPAPLPCSTSLDDTSDMHVVFVNILFLVCFHPIEHKCHKSRIFFLSLSFSAIIQCLGQCLARRNRCSVNDYWVNTCRNCLSCVATD